MAPPELIAFKYALPCTARRLSSGVHLVVAALGSSSTAGAYASSPDSAYPARLAVDLQARLPDRPLTVLNRGVNGEEAGEMLARLDEDVISLRPDLVIWQLGTNWLMQEGKLAELDVLVRDGIERLTNAGADTVLIDPQFAPPLVAKPDLPLLVELLSGIGDEFHINIFRRCAIMRYWIEVAGVPFDAFLAEDQFHMNDWSYACMARLLASSIAAAARPPGS